MSGDWSFAIGPPGLMTRELNAATSRKVSFKLSDSAEASVTIDGWDPAASEIVELATDMYVFRRAEASQPRQLLYRGRIGKTSDQIDDNGHTVSVPSVSYRGLLKRRLIMTGFTSASSQYVTGDNAGMRWGAPNVGGSVDQCVIAWELIDGVQNLRNGDLGITNGIGKTSGILRDRTYPMGDPISDKIDELSEVVDGFDWDITPTYSSDLLGLKLDRWFPGRGTVRNEVLAYMPTGSNVQSVSRQVDSTDFANAVRLTGKPPDTTGTTTLVAPPPVERPLSTDVWTTGAEGRWDKLYSTEVSVAATLAQRADWQLSHASLIQPSYTVKLKPDVWRGPDHFWVGDTVKLVVISGRLNIETDVRVVDITVDIDDDGAEDVSVTLGYPRKTFTNKLLEIDRRLARLDRR